MKFFCVTLMPDMFSAVTQEGVVGRAFRHDDTEMSLDCINPRDFTIDVHHTVDDRPYGGGPGMVMKAEPVLQAIAVARERAGENAKVVMMSPQGRPYDQAVAKEYAGLDALILVSGRYEGIDERVVALGVDEELSIGDYVLSGGELAAMVVIDSVVRLLPGVVGDERSVCQDSFAEGLLDHPHYTRPESLDGLDVPTVLTGGDHEKIRRWRLKQALGRTWQRRPELIKRRELNAEEQRLLDEFIDEHGDK